MTALPVELTALGPLWTLIAGVLALLLLEMFLKEAGRKILPFAAFAFLTLALVSDFYLLFQSGRREVLFNGSMAIDHYGLTLQAVCLLSALLTVAFSPAYLKKERAVTGEYYALVLLASTGMMVLVSASEFLTFFVGLELMSMAGYILAGYLRVQERSAKAALTYFLNGVFSSAFILYGIAILYGVSGSTHFSDLWLFMEKETTDPDGAHSAAFISFGMVLLLAGLGLKAALAPFHRWAPEVYDGAPAPVSAFLSAGVKTAIFGVLVRLLKEVLIIPSSGTVVLCLVAVLTMILGNVGLWKQTRLKGLMAYSSVVQAGYLAVGLAALAGGPADLAKQAIVFYLLAYTFMTAGVYGWIVWASGLGEGQTAFKDYKGLGYKHSWMGIALSVFMVSLAGLPPTVGFFGRYSLFKLAADNGMTWLLVIAVLNSLVSVFIYLKVVATLYSKTQSSPAGSLSPVSPGLFSGIFLCVLGSLAAGFLKFFF